MIKADDGCPINVEVEGDDDAPALMLSNSLGTNLHMWDDQAGEFAKHFRLIRYDRRGHGKSGVPAGPYIFGPLRPRHPRHPRRARDREDQLVRAVDGRHGRPMAGRQRARPRREARARQHQFLLRRQGAVGRPHQVRARERPRRAGRRRTWSAGSPRLPRARAADDRAHDRDVRRQQGRRAISPACEAIRDMDFRDSNPRITAPTLVIVGKQDPATPPAAGEAIAKQIKGAKLVGARRRAHLQYRAAAGLHRGRARLPARD